jgi:two-component system sensor histidine kinase QseC
LKPGQRLKSLQARLLIPLLGLVTAIWLGAAILTWVDARDELDDLLDGHLAQAAALLVIQQANAEGDEGEVANAPSLHKYATLVAFQVFHEGQLVMRSANAPLTPMSPKTNGFATVNFDDGERWRVFSTRGAARDVQVYVGEQTHSRHEITGALLKSLLLPLLLALPLLALGGWWAVRQGLAPLRQLCKVIGQRKPQALEKLETGYLPTEMVPIVQALNALFDRIESMVASERRFTADAAHELRTPIAGIRAQAQVAMGAGEDTAQRLHALQATLAGCDRATRLVEQLLTLARLEAAPTAQTQAHSVDLSQITRRVAADLALGALARQQTLILDATDACPLKGNDLLIGVLVRNLLDNALRYSPDGAQIEARVEYGATTCSLTVEDAGPGMSEGDRARLGERFFRVLGHEQTGSGLGWSIVKRIADVSGGQVTVDQSSRLGGLAVRVTWPNGA